MTITRRNTTLELNRLKQSTNASNDWLRGSVKVFDSAQVGSFDPVVAAGLRVDRDFLQRVERVADLDDRGRSTRPAAP